jgi:hypothetical protein
VKRKRKTNKYDVCWYTHAKGDSCTTVDARAIAPLAKAKREAGVTEVYVSRKADNKLVAWWDRKYGKWRRVDFGGDFKKRDVQDRDFRRHLDDEKFKERG